MKESYVTIEVVGHEWCYYNDDVVVDKTPYVITKDIAGNHLIYCRREKYYKSNDTVDIRLVKVLKEDMPSID